MAKNTSLDTLTIDELLALRDEIDTRLTSMATKEMKAMEKRMERLAKFAEVSGPTVKTSQDIKTPAKTLNKRKGKKAPIKFRHAKTGNEWSGRGLTPVWLRDYEANGGKRADLAV